MIRARVGLLAAGVLAAVALAPVSGADAAATGQITGIGGKCVDVAGANIANGTQVQLYDCNGTGAQRWTVGDDGTIRALGKCLDVSAGSLANGAKVQLWDCNGTGAQQWVVTSARDIVNPQADKCLDATGNSSANGTRLQTWTCAGTANQKWTAPTGSGPGPEGPSAVLPYLYLGWGNPPNPTQVMSATGVNGFTMAFVLSNGYCNPMWDSQRPLTGGVDQSTITSIRNAGGDVVPSFGGWSGHKLEESCSSACELANAYQKVIDAYSLSAIDIDLEASAYDNPTVQQRTVDALKQAKSRNPGLHVAVTIGTGQQGPDRSLINRAAASGLTVDAWTIMPFNFGGNGQDMGRLSTQAAEGLKAALKSAYGYSDADAYRRMGISSMNGTTDVGENVTLEDFGQMRSYAQQHGLARLTFWSVNRDPSLDFTRVFAQYGG
ncbi:chitinase [Nocardioides speluncae]|uniref:chitinase n=1 Tax=Nocardioides speluncae TaxID=2670337 RepID=UPI000D6860BF|nr:chitinase [Nocardioides speluncae]